MDDRQLTGSRVKELRLNHHESQAQVAEALGVDTQTVGRWERGENRAPTRHLSTLADRWTVPLDYLTGETNIADLAEFYLSEAAKAESAEAQHLAEVQAEHARIKSLFRQCGFCYDDLSESALYDFASIEGANVDPRVLEALQQGRLVRLTDLACPDVPPAYFNSEELQALFGKLHDVVAFECFKQRSKSKKGVSTRGNS